MYLVSWRLLQESGWVFTEFDVCGFFDDRKGGDVEIDIRCFTMFHAELNQMLVSVSQLYYERMEHTCLPPSTKIHPSQSSIRTLPLIDPAITTVRRSPLT